MLSSFSRRRCAAAGSAGVAQCCLSVHQASQEPTAARLRFQVAGPLHGSTYRIMACYLVGRSRAGLRPTSVKEVGHGRRRPGVPVGYRVQDQAAVPFLGPVFTGSGARGREQGAAEPSTAGRACRTGSGGAAVMLSAPRPAWPRVPAVTTAPGPGQGRHRAQESPGPTTACLLRSGNGSP